jgi:phenylacetate-coenzyme A ligase PaaK-like adenylate-forming protein
MIGKLIYEAEKFLDSPETGPELVEKYASTICKDLLFLEEKLVLPIIEKMKQNTIDFAKKYSGIYNNFNSNKIYTRNDLQAKKNWLIVKYKNQVENFQTSGSTTGQSFSYYVWKKYIDFIEDKNQYGMILDEYDVDRTIINKLNILILTSLPYNPKFDKFYLQDDQGYPYAMHTHKSSNSNRFFVNFENYNKNSIDWHDNLFKLIESFSFDVILTNAAVLHTLIYYCKKLNFTKKLCKLISHTGQFLIREDRDFLLKNKYINHFCDHMRCWDGGATFFTCKYGTYHLMDNLSFVEEIENKMISTDYFSLPNPFINYWNGDLCSIEKKHNRCECGRLYRNFEIKENRLFGIKGPDRLNNIKRQILDLNFSKDIDQIIFDGKNVLIHLTRKLNIEEENKLKVILSKFNINFVN